MVEYSHIIKNTVRFDGSTTYEGNFASGNYGGISTEKNSNVNFIGNTNFERNSARKDGGGIDVLDNSDVSFSGSTTLREIQLGRMVVGFIHKTIAK